MWHTKLGRFRMVSGIRSFGTVPVSSMREVPRIANRPQFTIYKLQSYIILTECELVAFSINLEHRFVQVGHLHSS